MKHISLNNETKQELIAKFTAYVDKLKLDGTSIHFDQDLNNSKIAEGEERPQIYIDSEAYLKMMLYVRDTNTEIAWHGTVIRDNLRFRITNVMLYPQILSNSTVNTDEKEYNDWLINLDDNTANTLRFQGHSHVNFPVSPSGTDMAYYKDILDVLHKNDYYIFMIMNKSGDMTFLLYDLATNMTYDTKDIDVHILGTNNLDLFEHIKSQKQIYCKAPTYNFVSQYNNPTNSINYMKSDIKTKTDLIFDDLDRKYEEKFNTSSYNKFINPKLSAKKGGKKK